ncbi:hypothetical protein M153_32620001308, partial [Pseudoloma neurophilia]
MKITPGCVSKILVSQNWIFFTIYSHKREKNDVLETGQILRVPVEQIFNEKFDQLIKKTDAIMDAVLLSNCFIILCKTNLTIFNFDLKEIYKKDLKSTGLRIAAHDFIFQEIENYKIPFFAVVTINGELFINNRTYKISNDPLWAVTIYKNDI